MPEEESDDRLIAKLEGQQADSNCHASTGSDNNHTIDGRNHKKGNTNECKGMSYAEKPNLNEVGELS